jgi:hypothetical protein
LPGHFRKAHADGVGTVIRDQRRGDLVAAEQRAGIRCHLIRSEA